MKKQETKMRKDDDLLDLSEEFGNPFGTKKERDENEKKIKEEDKKDNKPKK